MVKNLNKIKLISYSNALLRIKTKYIAIFYFLSTFATFHYRN